MIKSFSHKGLEKFFLTGSKAGIQPSHADKLARQLAILNAAKAPEEMDKPGWKLHQLIGRDSGRWSVWVNGNWRLTFKFVGEDAEVVDYQDYH
jgi:proteic killer suppression protein